MALGKAPAAAARRMISTVRIWEDDEHGLSPPNPSVICESVMSTGLGSSFLHPLQYQLRMELFLLIGVGIFTFI